ncbi:MAG: GIY-YIG nuclease family protein [Caulobacteraceae bacterium]
MAFYTYLVANHRNGTIYLGMTDDIGRRILEHKRRERPGFSAKYGCDKLVWYEPHPTREEAFRRERQIKDGAATGNSCSSKTTIRIGSTSTRC